MTSRPSVLKFLASSETPCPRNFCLAVSKRALPLSAQGEASPEKEEEAHTQTRADPMTSSPLRSARGR
eukprot:11851600-Alexandrium_andersonii.AAC.1